MWKSEVLFNYYMRRSEGNLTSGWRPFGYLDFVFRVYSFVCYWMENDDNDDADDDDKFAGDFMERGGVNAPTVAEHTISTL